MNSSCYSLFGFQVITFAFVFDLWLEMRRGVPDDTMVNTVITVGLLIAIVGPLASRYLTKRGDSA